MRYEQRDGETPLEDLSGLKIKIPNITRLQLDELEASNIQEAIAKYWSKRTFKYDLKSLKTLHKDMFGKVWNWAGKIRQTNTNLGSPSFRIEQDLLIMLEDLKHRPYDLDTGIWLHHRSVQIHPFLNGNGRWSRFLSDMWLKNYANITMRWPVGVEKESPIRKEYLVALKAADALDYEPLKKIYRDLI